MRPLLVTGPARSGTTLVARMLAAHADVEVAVDPLFPLVKAIRNALAAAAGIPLDPASPLQDDHGTVARVALLDAIVAGTLDVPADPAVLDALRPGIRDRCAIESPDLVDLAASVAGATFTDALAAFLAGVARTRRAAAGGVVGLKEVWAADLVPAFLRAMPAGRAILVRRDPRAVLASNLAMGRHDPSQVAHPLSVLRHWRKQEAIGAWLAGHPELAGRVLVVAYEHLVRAPQRVTGEIARFLGVVDDGSMTDPTRIVGASGKPFVANTSHDVRGAGLAPELADRWRRTLPPDRVAMTESVCGMEMRAVGYPPDGPVWGAEVAACLARAVADDHSRTWSWRSDLGEPALDLAVEVARHALVDAPDDTLPAEVERPLFLFTEARRALSAAAARPSGARSAPGVAA